MYLKLALFAGLILLSIDMACVLELTVENGMILYIYSTHNSRWYAYKPAAALEDYNMKTAFLTALGITLSIIVVALTLVKTLV